MARKKKAIPGLKLKVAMEARHGPIETKRGPNPAPLATSGATARRGGRIANGDFIKKKTGAKGINRRRRTLKAV